MKITACFLPLLLVAHFARAQQASLREIKLYDYRAPANSSAKKKTTAVILLAGGTAIAATGIAFMISGRSDGGSFDAFNDDDFESNDARFMGGFLATHIGAGLALTSIPFFRKARQLRSNATLQFKRDLIPAFALGGKFLQISQMRVGISLPL